MFNRIYQRINIALPKFLVALLVGLLLPPVSSITSVQILSPASAVAANPNPVCTASTCTVTFNTSTDFFTYTTPLANVTFAVRGGQGSANGGIVSGTLNAAAGTVLTIYVGAAASGSTGGKSGGRNSGGSGATTNSSYNGVGGGGHSEIVIAGNSAVIAGGGGGNGGWSGGAGGIGGSTRASGTLFSGASGGAGQAQGGTGGSSSGGGGGAGNGANSGTNGSAGLGGNGGYNALINGGGGGGGYFGGGGGGADSNSCCADGGGGGGGSSFVNATYISGLATFTSGNSGGGSVVISYPASYTVSFNANSGSGSPSVASVSQTSAGASVTLAGAGNLNRSGFTLAGWNTNETGTGTSYSLGQSLVPTSTLTLYAQWNSFIQYSANGATSGSPPDSTTARTALGATTLATNTRTLARTNYTFGGWNTNETGTGTSYTLPNTTYASTGNTTLFARWDSVITYLGNGNTSGSVPAATTMFGTSGTLASNTGSLTKTVSSKTFTFGGWNTNETGTGTAYAVSASYPPTGNRSLYAQWNTVVTYNGNSNTGGSVPSNTTITGTSGNLANNSGNLVNGTKVFAGWNTNSAGTGTRYAPGASFTNSGNVTLFAQWVNALTLTGSSSISVAQGSAFRSDTYTATNGLETKTVTYSLTPNNAGITLETSTIGATTNAFIRVSATVAGGTYVDTLTATDAMGATATLAVTVRIDSPIRWSAANGTTVTTTYGRSASLRLDTTNGFSNRVYTLSQVSSPTSSGITLDTTTAASQYVALNVSSTVAPGTYLANVTATDSSGTRVTTTITIIVNLPIIVSKDSSVVASTFGSMSFNASSNYVTYTGAAPSLQIGNTYTIEWWQYQTDSSSWPRIFSVGGSSFGVSIEGNSFYYWTGSANLMGTSNSNRKNKWTHFALVSNNGNMMAYQDGIALSATAKAVGTLNTSSVPNASTLCIASQCGGSGTFFGGNLTNFMISKRLDYSGTSTSVANFTPTSQIRVDSTTVLALTNIVGLNTFTDLSSSNRTANNYFSSTGSTMYPAASGANLVEVITTQGLAVTSSAFTATNGSGNKTFTMTSNYAPASITASTNSATVSISSAATANSSSQARITYETLTVTDTASSTISVPLKLTINPPVSLSATTLTLTTSAGIAAYDTITATFGTGTKTFSVVSSTSVAGISYSSPSTNTYLMTVSKTVPQGTYIETITARDSLGSTTSVVITVTVAPGLSLVSASGVNTLQTTFGRATSLRLDAQNGSGTRTFTLTQIGTTSAGITLNVSTASSGYVTLNIANTVAVGSYTDSITVTDTSGGRFSLSISVTVNAAQTLSYGGATSGTISLATTAGKTLRSNAFTAALGTGTRTLTISGRNVAISIDTSTANLGYLNLGSALTAGTYFETITATDSAGSTTLRSVTVTVNPAITLVATPISLTTTTGVAITDTVTATNGTGNKTFSLSVSPTVAGITFTNTVLNRAVITVANTVSPGSYTITLTASDSVSAITLINIPLLVNASLVINGPVALSSTAGYAFTSPTYSSSGGSGNTVYSVSGATGVRLSASSGTPTLIVPDTVTAATYNLTLRITDSVTATTTLAITLTVNPPVSLNGNKTLSKVYGEELTQVYQTNSGTAPFSLFASSICTTEKSTDGGYTVEKFAGTGSCTWNVPTGVSSLTVLTVAGGGGGGAAGWAGGGGAGGVVYVPNYSVTPNQNVSVEVGTGGNGGSNDTTCTSGSSPSQGSNGGNSSFNSTFTAIGGGGGGGYGWSGRTGCGSGKQGGNGGGSGETDYTPTIATSIQGTFSSANSYGNSGGRTTFLSGIQAGSGGGGAAAVGGSTSSSSRDRVAGAGGAGVSISITGSPVVYAGGGGGGTCRPCGNTPEGNVGVGGSGGGGSGGNNESSAGGGTNGLGGGGGGAQTGSGGKGGSGTVIVRYLTPTADSATTVLTMTTLRTTPTGSLQLNAPRNLPVLPNSGKYTQTITVTDASGSTGSTPVTIELTVIKATPSLSLSIPGGGTTATYGSPVSLTATSTTAGRFNFIRATTSISGCNEKTTSNGVATCSWTPTDTSTAIISAIFTPTDTTNYNSATSSTLTLTIAQADTLTVTFSPQVLTFTGTAAVISRAYTLNGLTSIDSITAVSTLVTGTANDSTSYNSATSPTKAGTYSLTGTAVTFSGSARASYYRSIVYIPGAITIERAANVISFNYGSSNTVVYRPTGVETVTAAFLGDGATTYSSADTVYCSLNSANGDLTTVQAGSCDISLGVAQGTNHLGDTVTATVTINRAPRTISVTSVANSLKYGETTTVTTAISFDGLDGVITYSNGVTTGCTFNSSDGLLTATSGTATCSIVASITDGINYQSATSSSLTITLNKADAPVVTLVAPANIDYSPTATSSDMERPTFTISGLQFTDTATALSDLTVTYVASGTYSYNNVTVPTGANTYSLTPSALVLSVGSISNYQTPSYVPANWTINKIAQAPLIATSLLQEGITVPFDIQYSGGTTNGTVSLTITAGGSATGCTRSGLNLQASSTGTCIIQLTMAGNQNYLEITSETITVTIANFIQSTFNFDNFVSGSTGITITSEVPIVVDVISCSADCVPTISGISPTAFQAGDIIVITGTDFASATEIIFNRSVFVTSFQIDSNDQITVLVPSGLTISANGSISVKNGSKISNRVSGLTITG